MLWVFVFGSKESSDNHRREYHQCNLMEVPFTVLAGQERDKNPLKTAFNYSLEYNNPTSSLLDHKHIRRLTKMHM